MAENFTIAKIIENNPIKDYLESKNILPTFSGDDRWMYHCPSPDHQDSDPSFSVFTVDGKQYCKCFGCGIKGDIINLYMAVEKVDMKTAINNLGGDIQYTYDDDIQYEIQKDNEQKAFDINNLYHYNFYISRFCFCHLQKCDFDEYEIKFTKRLYKRIDYYIRTMNEEKLKRFYDNFICKCSNLGKKHNRPKRTGKKCEINIKTL